PVASDEITFGGLGYADVAIESYALFSQLKRDGVLPEHYRFQVSLPTPLAPVAAFVIPEDRSTVERAYERAMFAELDKITGAIPHNELAIQWDVAIEFGLWEGTTSAGLKRHILMGLIQLGDRIPMGVELGYHLCYGDA